jgi:hypothetical protein
VINSPIVDLDVRRENARLRGRNRQLEQLLLDCLDAPYRGLTAWAATNACHGLSHPELEPGRCYCRKTKQTARPS